MSDIDELGRIDTRLKTYKRLVSRREKLRDKILDEYSNGGHQGETYELFITPKSQERLDSKRFERECPSIYSEYVKDTPYREVTTRKRST